MNLAKLINWIISSGLIKTVPVKLAERIIYHTLRKDPQFIKTAVDPANPRNKIIIVLDLKSFPISRYVTGKIISRTIYNTVSLIDRLGYHVSMFDEGKRMVNFSESQFVKLMDEYDGQLILAIEEGRIQYHYLLEG